MTYKEIIAQVAVDLNLPFKVVDRTYKSYWKVIRQHIETLPLKEDLTDEEFKALQPNVNIPSIGKLYVTLENYRKKKRQHAKIKEYKQLKQSSNVTH